MIFFKLITIICSLIPIEFIGLNIDYHTGSLIGYIPYVIVALLVSLSIFKTGIKNNIGIVISRIIGIFLSWVCVHLFMNVYNSSGYFTPFSTDGFAIFLGTIHVIVIIIIYLVIYSFSSLNKWLYQYRHKRLV